MKGIRLRGVVTSENEKYYSQFVILSTGHSARDIYEICRRHKIQIEMKSFAMGVRVEHPQELIDRIQYHGTCTGRLSASSIIQPCKTVDGRGVYSFCMCPGGFIVPSATSQEEVVVNGMSPSKRNSPYANSGIVVEIRPEDLTKYSRFEEFAGLEFQKDFERMAWEQGGKSQTAPAQRLNDFVDGIAFSRICQKFHISRELYHHRCMNGSLHQFRNRLRDGFRMFGSVMNGFLTNEAVILGVESRTSSPLRIPRNPETLEHISLPGLYPCGEGSGYAGGIVSSAVDGMKAAEAVAVKIKK